MRGPKTIKRLAPKEADEMKVLAAWLDTLGLVWFHPFNEAKRKPWVGKMLKSVGLKSGVSDVLIFNTPSAMPAMKGVALELKAIDGRKPTRAQVEWMCALRNVGWYSTVAYGADEAIRSLRTLGYGAPR